MCIKFSIYVGLKTQGLHMYYYSQRIMRAHEQQSTANAPCKSLSPSGQCSCSVGLKCRTAHLLTRTSTHNVERSSDSHLLFILKFHQISYSSYSVFIKTKILAGTSVSAVPAGTTTGSTSLQRQLRRRGRHVSQTLWPIRARPVLRSLARSCVSSERAGRRGRGLRSAASGHVRSEHGEMETGTRSSTSLLMKSVVG